jgi:hypothetical protein
MGWVVATGSSLHLLPGQPGRVTSLAINDRHKASQGLKSVVQIITYQLCKVFSHVQPVLPANSDEDSTGLRSFLKKVDDCVPWLCLPWGFHQPMSTACM